METESVLLLLLLLLLLLPQSLLSLLLLSDLVSASSRASASEAATLAPRALRCERFAFFPGGVAVGGERLFAGESWR